MCDYSLYTAKSRLAAESEDLVLHRFDSGSMGFCATNELERQLNRSEFARGWSSLMQWMFPRKGCGLTAVCIAPAARLRITGIPSCAKPRWGDLEGQLVYFTQLSTHAYAYRDALRLPSGHAVLLQKLPAGLRATVLALAPLEDPVQSAAIEAVPISI